MQAKGKVSEAEVIHEWLKAELWSKRFGRQIKTSLRQLKLSQNIILHPKLRSKKENLQRQRLLWHYRASLLKKFPKDVKWEKAYLSREDLSRIKFIDYDYWKELSGGSLLALDAADNVRKGVTVFNQSNRQFWETAKHIEKHGYLPKLILIAVRQGAQLKVLEGHLRLTAYLLVPDCIPNKVLVFIGYSPKLAVLQ